VDIDVGDTVPYFPTPGDVKVGQVFKVPGLDCRALTLDSGSKKSWAPSAGQKNEIITLLGSRGLFVPKAFRDEKWMVTGYPIQAEVYRTYCPWDEHLGVKLTVDVAYNEGISPSNYVNAPPVHEDRTWFQSGNPPSLEASITSGTPPPNFSDPWGGGVPATCKWKIEMVPSSCDYIIRGTFTLTAMPYDFLSGTAVVQVKELTCDEFHAGTGLTAGWVGVAYPSGPIGIVRQLNIVVRGSVIYTD
jgi:hypothetical protein